jgi:DNA-binding NarL/FixJ family response regulator
MHLSARPSVQRFSLNPNAASPPRGGLRVVRSSLFDTLTTREFDVMRLLSTGATNAQMANALDLSEGTVRNVVARVTCKLGVADRTQAALLGYRAGLCAVMDVEVP